VAALQLLAGRQRTRQAEEQHKIAVVSSLLTAAPDSVPYMLDSLATSKDLAVPLLRRHFEEGHAEPGVRLRAAIGLTVLGEHQTDFLLAAVPGAPAAESRNLALALGAVPGPEVAGQLRRRAARSASLSHRVRCAILLLDLGDDRAARALLAGSADPAPRSAFIDAFQ